MPPAVDAVDGDRFLSRVPSTPVAALTAAQRRTLAAAARRIVPHAFEDEGRGARLVDALVARIAALAPRQRGEVGIALTVLGARASALTVGLLPRPFADQGDAAQDHHLTSWLGSSVGAFRSIAQAVRRLVILTEYLTPEAQREIGYRGPYHLRPPAVGWEGALDGIPSDAEPVRRHADPASAHHPPPFRTTIAPLALDGSVLRADAIVIGTGAGGAVMAARLAEAGLDVLILEAGALRDGRDFAEHDADALRDLYADGAQRTTDDVGLSIVQGVGVGGGTNINWMVMLRTPDWVLEEWRTDHGTEGMGATELAPYFERIESEVHARVVPDDAHSPANRVILDGAATLGWSARAVAINAKDCVRTGFCGAGCRTGAKQGGLQTYLPRAHAAGARLLPHARVARIELAERSGRFPTKRVHFTETTTGRAGTAVAPIVIVAGGAIETPALLQRSRMGGGGTGRFLRLHPTTGIFGRYDREIYGAGGIPMSSMCDEFHRLDAHGYGVWIESPPLHPGIGAPAAPGFGAAHREMMLGFNQLSALVILARDGARRGQSDGDVRARRDGSLSIRYALSAADARHLETGMVAAARLHFAAGAREVHSGQSPSVILRHPGEVDRLRGRPFGANQLALFSAHVNGTARLGADRRTSGVDPHGEVWDAPGVFVADGSLLPTAPGVNPQETIMAVVTLIAERLLARRRTALV
jgi:choline dehydrogenase-like flavoprotein